MTTSLAVLSLSSAEPIEDEADSPSALEMAIVTEAASPSREANRLLRNFTISTTSIAVTLLGLLTLRVARQEPEAADESEAAAGSELSGQGPPDS